MGRISACSLCLGSIYAEIEQIQQGSQISNFFKPWAIQLQEVRARVLFQVLRNSPNTSKWIQRFYAWRFRSFTTVQTTTDHSNSAEFLAIIKSQHSPRQKKQQPGNRFGGSPPPPNWIVCQKQTANTYWYTRQNRTIRLKMNLLTSINKDILFLPEMKGK